MALKIERGRRHRPVRAGIYGPEKLGKSTLAAKFPSPIVLDTEDGTHHLDVARVSIGSWDELRAAIAEIGSKPTEFKTVVIDSADWAERLLVEHLLAEHKQKSIEGFGFGKGYTLLAEGFGRLLNQCDALVGVGLHVVFVAHSKVQKTSPPDQVDGYDRYELKLTKQTSPLLKEWCDILAFCNFKTSTREGTDGRTKAVGGTHHTSARKRACATHRQPNHAHPVRGVVNNKDATLIGRGRNAKRPKKGRPLFQNREKRKKSENREHGDQTEQHRGRARLHG